MADLLIDHVTKKFRSKVAVNDLYIELKKGELFVLLGPTGAGKTTTLRCVAGLEKPDHGSIYLDGINVDKFNPYQRNVAFVFQYYSLYPMYTVRENLEIPLKPKIRRYTETVINERVEKAAKILHIDHLLDRRANTLSGGEMQRVSIGRAIVRNPAVFLMDEPLSNLDAKLREELRAELKHLQIDLNATILFVTHDHVEAMTMADRIGIINHGKLLQVATPVEIYQQPKNLFVAAFVGSPQINILKSVVRENGRIDVNSSFSFDLEKNIASKLNGFRGEVYLGIRSEDFIILNRKDDDCIKARVYNIENFGMEKVVTLDAEGERYIKVTTGPEFSQPLDSEVYLSVKQSRIHFFDRKSHENLVQ